MEYAVSDFFETVRRAVVPKLGKVVQYLNKNHGTDLYVRSPAYSEEFAGRVDMPEEEFEKLLLNELDFETNPLAARKHKDNINGTEFEEGSFRWLPEDDDLDHRKQLHVRVFDGDVAPDADTGYVLLYAHWEYRWDTNPIKHYRAVDVDRERGVEMIHEMLDEEDVEYDTNPSMVIT